MNNLLKHLIIIFFLLYSNIGFAQWTQIGQAIEGENENDHVGRSVALNADGTRLVFLDAQYDDGMIMDAGRIRVFEFNGSSWDQLGQDILGEESDFFALSNDNVEINEDGSRIIVGAAKGDGIEGVLGFESGITRVFELNNGIWEPVGEPIGGAFNGDYCGYAVDITSDGNTVIIGSPKNDDNGNTSGHARVFKFNGIDWEQVGQNIEGDTTGDWFGHVVSIDDDGSRIAIASSRYDGIGNRRGHVKIYQLIDTTWVQLGQDIVGEIDDQDFGGAIDINSDGNIIAIANKWYGAYFSGQVKIYKFTLGSWEQLGQSLEGETKSFFGTDINLRGDGLCIAVGADSSDLPGQPPTSGYASVYCFDDQNWIQNGQQINAIQSANLFGWSISFSDDGSTVAVGAISNDNQNGENTGLVRIFRTEFVGVEESTLLNDFVVYPNPTQGIIVVEFDVLQNLDARLLSTTAQILTRQKITNSNKFDFEITGPSGVYFIEMIDEEKRSAVFEVVKE